MKNVDKFLDQITADLKLNMTDVEHDYILSQFNAFCDNLDKLEALDLNKYAQYLAPNYQFNSLRDDEPIIEPNPKKHFNNAVKFQNDYVVIENEKK